MTDQPAPGTKPGKPALSIETQSASAQQTVATTIIYGLLILGLAGIGASAYSVIRLLDVLGDKITPGQAVLVALGGVVTGGLSLAMAAVGALATALNAPSGVASVIASAKKPDP